MAESLGSPPPSPPTEVPPSDVASQMRCPICLDNVEDKAFTDPCFHSFCLACILQWSEVASSCPMCKTTFESLIHDVKASNDYKIMSVKPKLPSQNQQINIDEARRFMYRTTRRPGEQSRRYSRRVKESRKPASDERRSVVYRAGLRAQSMATEGSKICRVRNISASFFKANPAMTHRLLPWLSRDLRVILGEEHVEFMLQLVLSLIDKIDMESEEFVTHLQPFLHDKTEHFIHELASFAKSPLDMIAYDAKVSYDFHQVRPAVTTSSTATVIPPAPSTPQPGPSAGITTEMQWRLFDEMVATPWDDSPPLIRGEEGEQSEKEQDSHSQSSHSAVQSCEVTSSCSGQGKSKGKTGTFTSKGKGRARDYTELSLGCDMSSRSRRASCSETISERASRSRSISESRRASHRELASEKSSRSRDSTHHRHHSSSRRHYSSSRRHSLSHRESDSDSASHSHRHRQYSNRSNSHSPSSHTHHEGHYDKHKHKKYDHKHHHHKRHHHKKHNRYSTSRSPSPARSRRRRHSTPKSSCNDAPEDLHSIPGHALAQELESVEKEIACVKQQLLHKLLHEERAALIQQSLHTQKTGEERQAVTSIENERHLDKVTDELAAVEKAIFKEKQQLLHVMKRIEVTQMESDEDEDQD